MDMKYMGSKAKHANEIISTILKDIGSVPHTWVEPFVGGCNMIDKVGCPIRIGNDIDEDLIILLKAIQNEWEMPKEITKEQYYLIKNNPENYERELVSWVAFMCCYSGVKWGGYAGKTKTKIGTVRDYQPEAIKNINKQKIGLRDVFFNNQDYRTLKIPNNSVIYCGPPYKGVSEYKNSGFNHEEFWEWCNKQIANGHKVYVSEYQAPEDWKCIWSKEVKSSLSANGTSGGSKLSTEKLFTK